MLHRSSSAAGVRFLASIKEGRGLKPSARDAGIHKEVGYRWLRQKYLDLRRDGRSQAEPPAELGSHAFELAAEGIGYTFVSYHVGRRLIEDRGLHWVPLEPSHEEHFVFITRKNGAISPATAEFMQHAHRILRRIATQWPMFDEPS